MAVRAKFTVRTKKEEPSRDPSNPGTLSTIVLEPVIGGSPENEAFYAATPGGYITLATVSAAAGQQFEEGKSYYVDFSPAE